MPNPFLGFCPYLPIGEVIDFADWQLGPVGALEGRWADPGFKAQSKAFLQKFVDHAGNAIGNPSLLCRRGGEIDGKLPLDSEIEALRAAIVFAFLDQNPRIDASSRHVGWRVLTSDNTDLHFWPVDVEAGYVTVTSGLMVQTHAGGYRINDPELVIRPPLDLHLPGGCHTTDPECLEAVYKTVLNSLESPGANPTANHVKTAHFGHRERPFRAS